MARRQRSAGDDGKAATVERQRIRNVTAVAETAGLIMKTLTELSLEAEAALEKFAWGRPNAEAISFFNDMAEKMRAVPPGWAFEKIARMQSWARILYSAQEHVKYPDGATGVRHFLRCDLTLMRNIDRRYQRTAA